MNCKVIANIIVLILLSSGLIILGITLNNHVKSETVPDETTTETAPSDVIMDESIEEDIRKALSGWTLGYYYVMLIEECDFAVADDVPEVRYYFVWTLDADDQYKISLVTWCDGEVEQYIIDYFRVGERDE